ncbi:hypothetical protein TRVL_00252 [Trypanosoma vivax]|nr:hypothetical protein TRVL_00252 [Trypanosoma vivax]
MALSLRDVMARPTDEEAMLLLLNEHHRYCLGSLESECLNDDDQNGSNIAGLTCNNCAHFGLPNLTGAFNLRALTRMECPHTWIVPPGTIPSCCYESAVVHGGSDTSLLVDYSDRRCLVFAHSELLKPPRAGQPPQMVLAMWPEGRTRECYARPHSESTAEVQQERHFLPDVNSRQNSLYWPAYITKVVGVFDDPLLNCTMMTEAGRLWLQSHKDFSEIAAHALRTPMRICVDVTFCIDETSEARRLTITPDIRYVTNSKAALADGSSRISASTADEYDDEVLQHSERVCSMMKAGHNCCCIVYSASECPLLTPREMPQVVSIRNYSYSAVLSRGKHRFPAFPPSAACGKSISDRNRVFSPRSCAEDGGVLPESIDVTRSTSEGASPNSSTSYIKIKLNNNTLSHDPIAALDMLAGPICQAQQFVYLRPRIDTVVEVQRTAIEELRTVWAKLQRELMKTPQPEKVELPELRAEESVLPTLSAQEVSLPKFCAKEVMPSDSIVSRARTQAPLSKELMEAYAASYLQEDRGKVYDENGVPVTLLPRAPNAAEDVTVEHLRRHLKLLQGHLPSSSRGNRWEGQPPMALRALQCDAVAESRCERGRSALHSEYPSPTHRGRSPVDACRCKTGESCSSQNHCEVDAGPAGGPQRGKNASHTDTSTDGSCHIRTPAPHRQRRGSSAATTVSSESVCNDRCGRSMRSMETPTRRSSPRVVTFTEPSAADSSALKEVRSQHLYEDDPNPRLASMWSVVQPSSNVDGVVSLSSSEEAWADILGLRMPAAPTAVQRSSGDKETASRRDSYDSSDNSSCKAGRIFRFVSAGTEPVGATTHIGSLQSFRSVSKDGASNGELVLRVKRAAAPLVTAQVRKPPRPPMAKTLASPTALCAPRMATRERDGYNPIQMITTMQRDTEPMKIVRQVPKSIRAEEVEQWRRQRCGRLRAEPVTRSPPGSQDSTPVCEPVSRSRSAHGAPSLEKKRFAIGPDCGDLMSASRHRRSHSHRMVPRSDTGHFTRSSSTTSRKNHCSESIGSPSRSRFTPTSLNTVCGVEIILDDPRLLSQVLPCDKNEDSQG